MDSDRSSPTGHWVTSWPVMLWAALKIFCHVLHLALLHCQILPRLLKHRIHSILYRFYITLIHTKATLNYRQLQLKDSDSAFFSVCQIKLCPINVHLLRCLTLCCYVPFAWCTCKKYISLSYDSFQYLNFLSLLFDDVTCCLFCVLLFILLPYIFSLYYFMLRNCFNSFVKFVYSGKKVLQRNKLHCEKEKSAANF